MRRNPKLRTGDPAHGMHFLSIGTTSYEIQNPPGIKPILERLLEQTAGTVIYIKISPTEKDLIVLVLNKPTTIYTPSLFNLTENRPETIAGLLSLINPIVFIPVYLYRRTGEAPYENEFRDTTQAGQLNVFNTTYRLLKSTQKARLGDILSVDYSFYSQKHFMIQDLAGVYHCLLVSKDEPCYFHLENSRLVTTEQAAAYFGSSAAHDLAWFTNRSDDQLEREPSSHSELFDDVVFDSTRRPLPPKVPNPNYFAPEFSDFPGETSSKQSPKSSDDSSDSVFEVPPPPPPARFRPQTQPIDLDSDSHTTEGDGGESQSDEFELADEDYVGARFRGSHHLSKSKAAEMLHDNSAHGHPLTRDQRAYFAAVAGTKKVGEHQTDVIEHEGLKPLSHYFLMKIYKIRNLTPEAKTHLYALLTERRICRWKISRQFTKESLDGALFVYAFQHDVEDEKTKAVETKIYAFVIVSYTGEFEHDGSTRSSFNINLVCSGEFFIGDKTLNLQLGKILQGTVIVSMLEKFGKDSVFTLEAASYELIPYYQNLGYSLGTSSCHRSTSLLQRMTNWFYAATQEDDEVLGTHGGYIMTLCRPSSSFLLASLTETIALVTKMLNNFVVTAKNHQDLYYT